jgi:hypothetical protein
MFARWAKGARGTAHAARLRADGYGAALADHRARVYEAAAQIVRQMDTARAVAEMVRAAALARVNDPQWLKLDALGRPVIDPAKNRPLFGFDDDGLRFAQARAWQLCAWQLDPDVPEVQPGWD